MKSKVSLKELIGTKIIYACLLACYYLMWARQDWQNYYEEIQKIIIVFTAVFFVLQAGRIHKYGKEIKDERAIRNLHRTDYICLKILMVVTVLVAFAVAVSFFRGRMAGYTLMGAIVLLTIIRFIIFCVLDSKGA